MNKKVKWGPFFDNTARTFTYQVTQEGTGMIRLAYARPWEKDKPPVDAFKVNVNVLPSPGSPTGSPAPKPAPKGNSAFPFGGAGLW